MITNIRQPQFSDITHLVDIDLKCFEDNMDLKTWRMTFEEDEIMKLVGTLERTPVGFVLWEVTDKLTITRIGVKPAYRHRGIGTALINAVRVWAQVHQQPAIYMEVPESLCDPRMPTLDVTGWLLKLKFRGMGLAQRKAVFCGQPEDAFLFARRLENE